MAEDSSPKPDKNRRQKIFGFLLSHKKGIITWLISIIIAIFIGLYFNNGIIYYNHNFPNFILSGTDYSISVEGDQPYYIYPTYYDMSVFITNHWFEVLPTIVNVYTKPSDDGVSVSTTKCSSDQCGSINIPSGGVGEVNIRLNITNSSYKEYELCIESWENDRKENNVISCNPFYLQKVRESV